MKFCIRLPLVPFATTTARFSTDILASALDTDVTPAEIQDAVTMLQLRFEQGLTLTEVAKLYEMQETDVQTLLQRSDVHAAASECGLVLNSSLESATSSPGGQSGKSLKYARRES